MSTTGRDLALRQRLLLVLTAAATLALFGAYTGVSSGAVPLASSTAAGVLDVDTAINALTQADASVDPGDGDGDGDGDGGAAAQAVGTGDFHTQIAVADQSLALAAAEDVTGPSGRQTLQTVQGLTAVYSGWIEQAGRAPSGSALHTACLRYAKDVLGTANGRADDSTVMGRLAALHQRQVAVAREQASFGWPLWLGWTLAALLLLAMAGTLGEANGFLRRRFHRRWNRQLALAMALLVAGTGTAAVFTWQTHQGLAGARRLLESPQAGVRISAASTEVAHRMAGTGLRAAAGYGILAGGAAVAALTLWAFRPRIGEYRSAAAPVAPVAPGGAGPGRWWRGRRRRRAVVAGAVSLAVLAAAGVVVVHAVVWRGEVTVLANWTGGDAAAFRRQVIEPFEDKEHIHVLYQGSSAESQVLAADVESGTPPDVAVLPGPGELAEYAGLGRLLPLDGLVSAADFDQPWAAPAVGPDQRRHTYWVPVKTDLKSMVWHPADLAPAQVAKDADDPSSWCLGLASGATSGWPGTDWVEDILLQQQGWRTYQEWAVGKLPWTSQAVVQAFHTWGRLVGAGGPYAATGLRTGYAEESARVGQAGACVLEHQSTFVRGETSWQRAGAAYTHSHDAVPDADARETADWEVSGDLAAMLGGGSQARELIAYLARPDVQKRWSQAQDGFSADRRITAADYPDATDRQIAATLRDPGAIRCYDASDAMPSAVRDAFELAAIRYLADPSTLGRQLSALKALSARQGSAAWQTSVCGSG